MNSNFNRGQSYSYIMRKVWYHQIWIQNYLGFHCDGPNLHTKWYVSNLLTVLLRCLLAILSGYICANLSLSWDTLLSGYSFAILLWDLLTRLYGHLCTLLSGNCRTLLSLNGLTVFLWDVCANLSWYLRALLARNLKIEFVFR